LEIEMAVTPGLPRGDVAHIEKGFLILTQQCDLAREPSLEPTLEVIPITRQRAQDIPALRSLKSWRQLVVADVGDDQALVADSRTRLLLDKRCLLAHPAIQVLPDVPLERRRFAWWAGARYFRRPVPTELFLRIERPLREALKDDDAVAQAADGFLMFIVDAAVASAPRLLGIFDEERDRVEMEQAMDVIFEHVAFEGLTDIDYDALPLGQTPLPLFLGATSYVLDLEGFSGGESPQPPTLEA
jgi:hypothetical protein